MKLQGEALNLSRAARHVERRYGRKIHSSTVFRWCTKGLVAADGTRVRLQYLRIGRKMATDAAALEAFFNELAEADRRAYEEREAKAAPKLRPRGRTAKEHEEAIAAAEAVFDS